MSNKRTRKYLLFMFGSWITLERNEKLFNHIKDVLETVLATPELSFVTGEHTMIACIKSNSTFREIEDILDEFLNPEVPVYFLMPKPRNLAYRLNPILEQHLFKDNKDKNKPHTYPPPQLLKDLIDKFKKTTLDRLESFDTFLNFNSENFYNPKQYEEHFSEEENLDIDSILDKINNTGLKSLSIREKKFLDKQKK